jgi:hypothetical protein
MPYFSYFNQNVNLRENFFASKYYLGQINQLMFQSYPIIKISSMEPLNSNYSG